MGGNGENCVENIGKKAMGDEKLMEKNRSRIIISALGAALFIAFCFMVNYHSKNVELEKTVQAQASTIEELQNGAERRIAEIRDLFAHKQFKELYQAAAELSKYHPGSKEANEAQEYVMQAQAEEAATLAKQQEEAQKQKEIAERSNADKARSIIQVSKVSTNDPNSAGGVNFSVVWQNTSDKVIKYCYFTVVPYNSVGDAVSCTIRHQSEFTGKVTGPINPGQRYGENYSWQNAWYNNSIVKAKLTKIRIEYMDGTSQNLTGQDVNYVQL